ncbi:glutamate-cysteine ligase family protein [Niallia sp. 03133]|uniref:glutamate-cysteine ligase family protein n=1 Tax=Niallia sp. 03133 TaxID=3458060 RepID=UPI004044650F
MQKQLSFFEKNDNEFKMGLEVELMLTDKSYTPLHVSDLPFDKMKNVLENTEGSSLEYLVTKYPGANSRPYYLEGYDFVNKSGEFTSLDVKGIEISTPIAFTISDLMDSFQVLYKNIQTSCLTEGMNCVCFGTHPAKLDYEGPRGVRGIQEWASAEVAMTTFGIHVNASLPLSLEKKLNREELHYRFNYVSPAFVLFSANTPFRHGEVWDLGNTIGKSDRSYRRTFTRDTLYFRDDQNYRKEVTLFDMTNSLELIQAYTALTLGIMLDETPFPYLPDTFSKHNIQEVSKFGYKANLVNRQFQKFKPEALAEDVLLRAAKSLDKYSLGSHYLQPLNELLKARKVPADFMLSDFNKQKDVKELFKSYSHLSPLPQFNK